MTDQSATFSRGTSTGTPSATSSQDSAAGPELSASLDGPTTDLFGRAVHPASPSPSQEKAKEPQTPDTFGQVCLPSSESAVLQSSLESRLRERLGWDGSTPWQLTWKKKTTPSRRPYCQLALSVRRTDATASGLWATPTSLSYAKNGNNEAGNSAGLVAIRKRVLEEQAMWPTPTVGDSQSSGSRNTTASKAHPGISLTDAVRGDGGKGRMWPTPRTPTGGPESGKRKQELGRTESGGGDLLSEVRASMLPTPAARDYRSPNLKPYSERGGGKKGEQLPNVIGGQLNPTWVGWLMGYPPEWVNSAPLAMPSSRKSRKSSSGV
jgi:hypothetical protein